MQTECLLPNFAKMGGLVPVVVQSCVRRKNGKILMVAYANEEAYRLTLETGLAHFWSRSRGKLWKKGETSGNVMMVTSVNIDCDGDALIYRVRPSGPVCCTGEMNCFFRNACDHRGVINPKGDRLQSREFNLATSFWKTERKWPKPE